MTLANRITLLRAALALVMFFLILLPGLGFKIAALITFALAALTDWLDGKIARDTGTTTAFGMIADPFVDKLLVGAAFIAFASLKHLEVPAWAVFLIVAREMMISSLRALAALNGKVLAAETSGKFKTVVQMTGVVIILAVLVLQTCAEQGPERYRATAAFLAVLTQDFPYFITLLAVIITWTSGISYLSNHWALLQKSWSAPDGKTPAK